MAIIEGIKIINYGVLQRITLGRVGTLPEHTALTPITTVIGKNGVGKSTLFDAFGFLADCLKVGVEEACDLRGRGGFDRICSQGMLGTIVFEVCYRQEPEAQLITYMLIIEKDESGRPFVANELLYQSLNGEGSGAYHAFLMLSDGVGAAWKGDAQGQQIDASGYDGLDFARLIDRFVRISPATAYSYEALQKLPMSGDIDFIQLQDNRRLGISTLGALKQHPRISAFREFVEGWYLSYFTPDAARGLPLAGPQRRLNIHGDNLGNVVQFMQREHPDRFDRILEKIAARVPGIDRIETERGSDGRLLLKFNDRGFQDPFYAQQMSDGTLKVFAYLLMLEDPQPPPFICIEEPENGLYHKLLEVLAAEFRSHATGGRNAPQIFVTTHQPYLVDALSPEETWVLEKGQDGFATIRRASDDPIVKAMVEEGLPLGSLWYSDYLDMR